MHDFVYLYVCLILINVAPLLLSFCVHVYVCVPALNAIPKFESSFRLYFAQRRNKNFILHRYTIRIECCS